MFLICLKDVDETSTLTEIIFKQHAKLNPADKDYINLLLKGCPKYNVLLILDGYNEYKPGTNREIDATIQNPVANLFLIVTSRPDFTTPDGRYIGGEITEKMDAEVRILGFSEETINRCAIKHLGDITKCKRIIKLTKATGIYRLLRIPTVLLMVCVEFSSSDSIFRSRTKIYEKIFHQIIDRTILKTFPPALRADVKEFLNTLLVALGELSWESLQDKETNQQFVLARVSIPGYLLITFAVSEILEEYYRYNRFQCSFRKTQKSQFSETELCGYKVKEYIFMTKT